METAWVSGCYLRKNVPASTSCLARISLFMALFRLGFSGTIRLNIGNWRQILVQYSNVDIFYILVTVHLGIILMNNQIDTLPFMYIYFDSLHVSSNLMLIIRRVNCINTTSGICRFAQYTIRYAGRDVPTRPAYRTVTYTE
jgi:hypothetical protein